MQLLIAIPGMLAFIGLMLFPHTYKDEPGLWIINGWMGFNFLFMLGVWITARFYTYQRDIQKEPWYCLVAVFVACCCVPILVHVALIYDMLGDWKSPDKLRILNYRSFKCLKN